MATTLRTVLIALGFVFSTVNASPAVPTGQPKAQQAVNCLAWYLPQAQSPPETCTDVVNKHPGLDLATLLKLNPMIHSYCDNMMLGQKVCIRASQENDCPKPTESSRPVETSPKQWESSRPVESSPKQWESSRPVESSPKQWATSSSTPHAWH